LPEKLINNGEEFCHNLKTKTKSESSKMSHKEIKLPFKACMRRPEALVKHFTLHNPTNLNFVG